MSFTLPELPYAYNALEPHYDAQTVEIHHSKHHQTYITKLNGAAEAAGIADKPIEEILTSLDSIEDSNRTAVRNHAGGVWNHTFFWNTLSPKGGGSPKGKLAAAISQEWGSFEMFKEKFSTKAATHFGSGWAWLVVNKEGKLEITETHDQVSPISLAQKPILTIDVWEHAYYLKFKNVRPDWIASWWNMVDWNKANERFNQ